ncbi:MAG: hypothetical protein J5661_02250 [Bacteroidaceae bacterium]|nr:hypothetical protein [Bacteroidaceae bacterium]
MKKLAFLFLLLTLLSSACRRDKDAITHERVRQVAEQYFSYLVDGKYDKYVEGMVDADSMPDLYRSQLIDMVAQFVAQQKGNHGGLAFACAMTDSLPDSIHAHVFLDVHFADSTVERIGMPLRYQNGRWKME